MNKLISRQLILLLAVLSFLMPVNVSAQFNTESARTTLLRYFDALTNGDVQVLSELMTEKLRTRHRALLSNSGYGDTLVRIYNGANFSIDAVEQSEADKATAQVLFRKGSGQAQRLRIALVTEDEGNHYLIEAID